jgi:hypothetical protein
MKLGHFSIVKELEDLLQIPESQRGSRFQGVSMEDSSIYSVRDLIDTYKLAVSSVQSSTLSTAQAGQDLLRFARDKQITDIETLSRKIEDMYDIGDRSVVIDWIFDESEPNRDYWRDQLFDDPHAVDDDWDS